MPHIFGYSGEVRTVAILQLVALLIAAHRADDPAAQSKARNDMLKVYVERILDLVPTMDDWLDILMAEDHGGTGPLH
jgi:hypothetical protein